MYYDDIYAMLDLNDYEIKEIPIKYIPKINNKRFPFKQYSGLSIFRLDNTLIYTNVEYFDLYDIRDDTLLIHFKSRQYIK